MSPSWNVVEGEPIGSGYTLQVRIGSGAMGQVWRASDHEGNPVAIKILRPELGGDTQVVTRFLQEAQILERISGPNVVQVRDLVAEGSNLAIVMDLVDGPNLRTELTRRGTYSPAEAAVLLDGILTGLGAVHGAKVVHRDVKPENILLAGGTSPRLTDFGISRIVEESASTRTTLIGTPEYLAPEVINGEPPTVASDLYAVGALAYELLTGVTPFAGGNPMAVMRRHVEQAPGRPSGIPDHLWELIASLLAKDPTERPASAAFARSALAAIAPSLVALPPSRKLDAPPTPTPVAQATMTVAHAGDPLAAAATTAAHPKRRRWWIWATAAAVVLILAGGGTAIALTGRDKPANPAAQGAATTDPTATTPSPTTPAVTPTPTPKPTPTPTPTSAGVPAVTGLQLSRATTAISQAGLKLVINEVVDESVADGTVTAQTPEAGAAVPADKTVSLTVARKPVVSYLNDHDLVEKNSSGYSYDTGSSTVNGQLYTHSLWMSTSGYSDVGVSGSVQWDLSRAYQSVSGVVGLSDSTSSGSQYRIELLGDNRVLYTKDLGFGQTEDFSIDVTGVLRLQLRVTKLVDVNSNNTDDVVLADTQLSGLPGVVPTATPTP